MIFVSISHFAVLSCTLHFLGPRHLLCHPVCGSFSLCRPQNRVLWRPSPRGWKKMNNQDELLHYHHHLCPLTFLPKRLNSTSWGGASWRFSWKKMPYVWIWNPLLCCGITLTQWGIWENHTITALTPHISPPQLAKLIVNTFELLHHHHHHHHHHNAYNRQQPKSSSDPLPRLGDSERGRRCLLQRHRGWTGSV